MADTILKVSVLASGDVLLDGKPVTVAEIEQALEKGVTEGAKVWYYRENAAGPAPPAAAEIIKMVTAHRLPVRLSSKADFSDSVGPAESPIARIFAAVRLKAQEGNVVVLRPDGRQMAVPVARAGAVPAEAVAAVERILPSAVKRNVAVLADTAWTMGAEPSLQAANQAIPFFGMLMGFGAIGHAVWVFDGVAPAALAGGGQEADVLIVDSMRLSALPPDWQQHAARTMRGRNILIHERATYQLRKA